MEDNTKRLNEIYDYLLYKHIVSGQNDFADALKTSRPNVTAMLNGRQRVTDDTLRKVCNAFPNTFSMQYLLSGEGQLLVAHGGPSSDNIDQSSLINAAIAAKDETIRSKDETIASLRETIESLKQQISMLRNQANNEMFTFPIGVAEEPTNLKANQ